MCGLLNIRAGLRQATQPDRLLGMLGSLLLVGWLGGQTLQVERGQAGVFTIDGSDRWAGPHGYACERIIKKRYGVSGLAQALQSGFAHRSMSCGQAVMICAGAVCTHAYVVDRGPWGVLDAIGRWRFRPHGLQAGEHYRGIADLTPQLARTLRFSGLGEVSIVKIP